MEIKTFSHPALHAPALEVPSGEDVTPLVNEMWRLMFEHRGIGLAANQVGELKRLIVVSVGGFRQEIINPVITKRYGGRNTSREGCLSFPGAQITKVRDNQIIVEGFDRKWSPIRRKLKGLAARCVQHEVDHLDGKNITDTEARKEQSK